MASPSDTTDSAATPRCSECGHAIDDVSKMSQSEVLEGIQDELLRDLLRSIRSGHATHQELAIARGVLRDHKMQVPGDNPEEQPEEAAERFSWQDRADGKNFKDTEGG